MTERELFKQAFDTLHASESTVTEVMKMAKENNIYDTQRKTRKKRRPARMAALIAAAAALLITGAFAAGVFGLQSRSVGDYGRVISVSFDSADVDTSAGRYATVEAGWLPDGMTAADDSSYQYFYEDTPYQGGFSIAENVLDTGEATFCELVTDVDIDEDIQESLTVGSHEAIYFQWNSLVGDGTIPMDKRLYIAYPEANQVLTIYIGSDVDKETAIRFAEGLIVTADGEEYDEQQLAYLTYLYQQAADGRDGRADEVEYADGIVTRIISAIASVAGNDSAKTALSADQTSVFALGETASVLFPTFNDAIPLDVTVTDVAVSDDFSILPESDPDGMADWAYLLDENGKLPVNTVNFIRGGNGIDTLSQTVIGTQEEQTMFVVASMEITNTTGEDLENINFMFDAIPMVETEDGYESFTRTLDGGTDYDYIINSVVPGDGTEMCYYSVHTEGVSNGTNYIGALAAGETVTMQVGWLVNADEVPYLYMSNQHMPEGDNSNICYFDLMG